MHDKNKAEDYVGGCRSKCIMPKSHEIKAHIDHTYILLVQWSSKTPYLSNLVDVGIRYGILSLDLRHGDVYSSP